MTISELITIDSICVEIRNADTDIDTLPLSYKGSDETLSANLRDWVRTKTTSKGMTEGGQDRLRRKPKPFHSLSMKPS